MMLGFASAVIGAPPKRIQNACALLGRGFQYPIDDVRRLGLAFWLVDSFVMELAWAWEFAGQALKGKDEVARFGHPGGPVLEIDVGRYLSDFALASASALKDPPRTVGRRAHDRPRRPRNAIKAARDLGIDVDALEEGLKRSPDDRLKSLSVLPMVAGLVDGGVRFVVTGGVAGAAHGSRRVTDDLDICYEPNEENRKRLAARVGLWRAYPRGVELGLPFVMDEVTLHRSPTLILRTDEGDLDCFTGVKGVGAYKDVAAASVPANLGALQFRVLSLPALIKARRAAGRPKDQEALLELEALAELSRPR